MWFTNKTFFSEKWKKKENIWFRKFDMKAGENERFGWQIGQRWMAILEIYLKPYEANSKRPSSMHMCCDNLFMKRSTPTTCFTRMGKNPYSRRFVRCFAHMGNPI